MQVTKDKIVLQLSDTVDVPASGKLALHVGTDGVLKLTDSLGNTFSVFKDDGNGDLTISNLASISGSDNYIITSDIDGTLQKSNTTIETISGGDMINMDEHLSTPTSQIGDFWFENVAGQTFLNYKNSSGVVKSVELS